MRCLAVLVAPDHEDRIVRWREVSEWIEHCGRFYKRTAEKTAGGYRVYVETPVPPGVIPKTDSRIWQ